MTAKDLLIKLLDYRYLWCLPHSIHSEPSRIRKKQIEAMQHAFGLSKKEVNPLVKIKYSVVGSREEQDRISYLSTLTTIDYLTHGEFLHDRPKEKNQELSERALKTIRELYPDVPEDRMNRPVDIGWMFNSLLNFRQEIYNVSYPNGGMLEGFSVGLHYGQYLQHKLKQIILDNIEEIDETLWLILDPEKRVLDKQTVIDKHGYPDVDMDKIDLAWRIENY